MQTKSIVPQDASPHASRLDKALRELLLQTPVATLGTVTPEGHPFVSMVPWAMDINAENAPEGTSADLILHVSALASHTRHMQLNPRVSLLIMASPEPSTPVQALSRVTITGEARTLTPQSTAWIKAREAYLARFAETGPIMALPDFSFVAIHALGARHIAGFGAARDVSREDLCRLFERQHLS